MYNVWKHLLRDTFCFGGLCEERSPILIVGCPLDATTSYKPGTRFAPLYIRTAAENLEFYSVYFNIDVERHGFHDIGDIFIPPGGLERSLHNIEAVYKGILGEYGEKTPLCIGGEHLVTLPIVKAMGNDIDVLLVFDAHFDLREEYLGERMSHACVMRRIIDKRRNNIELVYIGVRAYTSSELMFVKNNNLSIKYYSILDIEEKINEILKYVRNKNVYISIDMDVFDPAYAPGVGNPEPNGITPREFFSIYSGVLRNAGRVVGIDVVETNPLGDINDITSLLAARIIVETAGAIISRRFSGHNSY